MMNANTGIEKQTTLKINSKIILNDDIAYCDGYANAYAEMLDLSYEEANVYFEKCMSNR